MTPRVLKNLASTADGRHRHERGAYSGAMPALTAHITEGPKPRVEIASAPVR